MAAQVYDEGIVPPGINRAMITMCVILSVIMQALDTTIANVALPHMQGSVSASADQISWVLTSYIVAAAIMTPPSGFLTSRFGRRRVLLISVAGFVVASMLCGAAQSLTQIVLFRLLQGAFGAALVPIAQAVMLDIYTAQERPAAMGIFGVAVMVGPVLGPVIGGWLTDQLNWRWIFYINLPIGALALAGIWFFMYESRSKSLIKLDWIGFGSLSIFIAALQLFLDRGSQLDWFSSLEILLEAVIAASAFYIFMVHIFTTATPFINPRLFLDRNYAIGIFFIFIVGATYIASMALMTPYLQTLMGYPVVTAGLVMGPRGLGTMVCMFLVGRLVGKIDTRLLLGFGLALSAWAMNEMAGWTPDVSETTIAVVGFVQGAGMGFLFVPINTITFATLAARDRGEATGMFSLSRNIGSAVGISFMMFLLTRNTQINHALIGEWVTPFNRMLENPAVSHMMNPTTATGRALLDLTINQQAAIIAYMNDYKVMMIMCIAVMPLLLLVRKSAPPKQSDHAVAME